MGAARQLALFRRPRPEAPLPAPSFLPADETGGRLRGLRALLPEALQRHVTSGRDLLRSRDLRPRATFPSGIEPLDRLLRGGLERGRLTEVSGWRSSGRFGFALALLASMTSTGEPAALIDLGDQFDPRRGEEAGIDLERLLWVRPESAKDALATAEIVIATGFRLVVIDLGIELRGRRSVGRIAEAAWRRIGRAAEEFDAVVLLSSPFHLTTGATDAALRLERSEVAWLGSGISPRLLDGLETSLRIERHQVVRPGHQRPFRLSER